MVRPKESIHTTSCFLLSTHMDPYTPRARAGGRKKNLGLSAKEYTKVTTIHTHYTQPSSNPSFSQITGTIASVRRHRHPQDEVDDDIDIRELHSREDHSKSTCSHPILAHDEPHKLSVDQNDSSFIAETSFVRAPLNSRVVSNANAPKVKGKGKQEPLDRVPLEIQEAMILEDLLFVLMVSILFLSFFWNRLNMQTCRALKEPI